MGRRLAVVAAIVASAGVIASASANVGAQPTGPVKTTAPTGATLAGPGSTTPSTTLWPTTSVPGQPSTSSATPSAPVTSTPGAVTTGPLVPATVFPPTSTPPAAFDALTFFTDFYRQLGTDPFVAADMLEQVAVGSPAEAFLFHEVGVAIAIFGNTDAPLPTYTVTASGADVRVCRPDGMCETLGGFVAEAGRLDTFTVDAIPIAERTGAYERQTTVEALTVNASFSLRRPSDDVLSVVVLVESNGGTTRFTWTAATYVDATGRQFAITPTTSQFPAEVEDAGIGVAHLSFPGAQHGGQLTIPITTDLTGVATTIHIPVTLVS